MAHAPVEVLRVMYLDRQNQLIADETPWRGTVDHVPPYPRETLRRPLLLRATALILPHNPPPCDHTPSHAHITLTRHDPHPTNHLRITLHHHLTLTPSPNPPIPPD